MTDQERKEIEGKITRLEQEKRELDLKVRDAEQRYQSILYAIATQILDRATEEYRWKMLCRGHSRLV